MKLKLYQILLLGVGCGAGVNSLRNGEPAKETKTVKRSDSDFDPLPTARTELPIELAKRQQDTEVCGYVSGVASLTFGCSPGVYCFSTVIPGVSYSLVDCCRSADVKSCVAATTCLDSTQSTLMGTTSTKLTYICDQSDYPYCVTYSYGPGSMSGYTWLACGKSRVIRTAYPTIKSTIISTTTTDSTTTSDTTTSSVTTGKVTTSSTATSTPAPPTTGNDPPIAAIVGGTVGGVAVIAILAGVFAFVWFKRKKSPSAAPAPAPQQPSTAPMAVIGHAHGGAGGAPPSVPMADGAAYYDPRASIAKPNTWSVSATPHDQPPYYIPAPGSPPPQGPGSPPPTSPNGYNSPTQYSPTPQGAFAPPTKRQQHAASTQFAAELPDGRGDRELRELA